MNGHQSLATLLDRLIHGLIALLVLGSILSFGGAVWWFPPALVGGAFLLMILWLAHRLLQGSMPVLKSPLTALGVMSLGLALLQLTPLPASLAMRISPSAHEVYARGSLPRFVHKDDPDVPLVEPAPVRSPLTLDRPATLRWLIMATACVCIFSVVSHFTDRLARLYLIWGLVIGGFFLNVALAVVQISNRSDGLYGLYVPGSAPVWAPSTVDLLSSPSVTVLENLPNVTIVGASSTSDSPHAVLVPVLPFLVGTSVGGPGTLLVMGALALPVSLAMAIRLAAPQQQRGSFFSRLSQSSEGSLVLLLALFCFLASLLMGLIGSLLYWVPLALGTLIVIGPALLRPRVRWPAFCLLFLLLLGFGSGVVLQSHWPAFLGDQVPVRPPDQDLGRALWASSLDILREFPIVGAGLGSFGSIQPYFKSIDVSSTTAMSSLLQWAAETGAVGLLILGAGAVWCLVKLPSAIRRIHPGDRCLAHGLLGAVMGLSVLAMIHWTVELSAVAVSASALGGTWNRWLSGATDLFTECS